MPSIGYQSVQVRKIVDLPFLRLIGHADFLLAVAGSSHHLTLYLAPQLHQLLVRATKSQN